jgi:hypothetical protein
MALDILGTATGGALDIFGGNKGANIQRRATRKAGKFIDEGYGGALDLAAPMQEQSQKDYLDLSQGVSEGRYSMPDQQKYQAGTFDFDPNDVFNDPEYKAQMRAGTDAINQGAASKGMLFSGNTGRDLTKFGSDLFAGRSDELYNRGRSEFEDDRNFDYDAGNRAYDTNTANREREYGMGADLASFAPEALDRTIDLGLGRAQGKADTELGVGDIRANNYRRAYGKAGRLSSTLGSQGQQKLEDLVKMLAGG